MLQVAVVEVIETRVAAHESGLGDRSHDEDRRGGAVVGPRRRVLLHPAAELAEREQGDAVPLPGGRRGRRGTRRPNRRARFRSAACVPSWLAWVSKPSSEV